MTCCPLGPGEVLGIGWSRLESELDIQAAQLENDKGSSLDRELISSSSSSLSTSTTISPSTSASTSSSSWPPALSSARREKAGTQSALARCYECYLMDQSQ